MPLDILSDEQLRESWFVLIFLFLFFYLFYFLNPFPFFIPLSLLSVKKNPRGFSFFLSLILLLAPIIFLFLVCSLSSSPSPSLHPSYLSIFLSFLSFFPFRFFSSFLLFFFSSFLLFFFSSFLLLVQDTQGTGFFRTPEMPPFVCQFPIFDFGTFFILILFFCFSFFQNNAEFNSSFEI